MDTFLVCKLYLSKKIFKRRGEEVEEKEKEAKRKTHFHLGFYFQIMSWQSLSSQEIFNYALFWSLANSS